MQGPSTRVSRIRKEQAERALSIASPTWCFLLLRRLGWARQDGHWDDGAKRSGHEMAENLGPAAELGWTAGQGEAPLSPLGSSKRKQTGSHHNVRSRTFGLDGNA